MMVATATTTTSTTKRGTEICRPAGSDVSYVTCNSLDPFVMPAALKDDDNNNDTLSTDDDSTPDSDSSVDVKTMVARRVNAGLNLDLGLPSWLNPRKYAVLLWCCRLLSRLVETTGLERFGIVLWLAIPLRLRHLSTMVIWRWFYRWHRVVLGRRTGIHRDASPQYHALSSLMWWGNLFPQTLSRMRLMLNQIQVLHPPSQAIVHVNNNPTNKPITTTPLHNADGVLMGVHLQLDPDAPSDRVIFWLYGGAYLSGDCEGNLGVAETVGRRCRSDVFVAHYRLLPEADFEDALDDVCQAYAFLLSDDFPASYAPGCTHVLGISSGGGLAVRLLQSLASDDDSSRPAGAVLLCPFVDYTEPTGSFAEYYQHDLVVNRSVYEIGVPYLASKLGSHAQRKAASPSHRSCRGLPPLCVVVSEHECVYDQVVALVNRARADGVDCTLGVWRYLCHVFPMLSPFVPEGKQAMDLLCAWLNRDDPTQSTGGTTMTKH